MQLAQKLNLTFQQVQKYEKGTNRVGAGRLFDIARVFGIAIEDLFPKADWLRKFPPTGAHNSHDIATLVSSIETLRLVQAFTSIGDPKMRKRLLSFVQEIASDKEDEKTPSN
jgi:transcriptional regulator with XRE-family HTH domain